MVCNICGQEFGAGTNCQHCGADRVTAGANANGYTIPAQNNNQSALQQKLSKEDGLIRQQMGNTTICPFCGEVIPNDADYCPYCSRKQKEECPKCKNTYSAKFPACPKCGTNREQFYAEEKRREQEAALERKKEAEKRRQQQVALEEERQRTERILKESFCFRWNLPSKIPNAVINSPIEIEFEKGIGKVTFGMTMKEVTDIIGAPACYILFENQDIREGKCSMRFYTKTEEVSTVDFKFCDNKLFSITIKGKFPLSKGLCIELFNTRLKWFDQKALVNLFKQHEDELPYGFIVRNNIVYCGASFFDIHTICLKQTLKKDIDWIRNEYLKDARNEYRGSKYNDWVGLSALGLFWVLLMSPFYIKNTNAMLVCDLIAVLSLILVLIIHIHNLKLRKRVHKEFKLEKYGFTINQIK